MIPNFIQKPFGAAAVLAAAIGGPYAAFETETGASLRRSLFNAGVGMGTSPADGSDLANGNVSNDSSSNNAWNGNVGSSSFSNDPNQYGSFPPGLQSQYSGRPVSVSYGQPTVQPLGPPYGQSNPYGASMPGSAGSGASQPGLPSVYGSSVAVGNFVTGASSVPGNPAAVQYPSGILETRQGPTTAIPGGTNQLWDYTLGVPTLQQLQQQPSSLGGGEVHDLREVLRFDIAPNWLPQRFSRVSTVLSNVQMDGLRVPLITGTRPTDIAGTLTYYFDAGQSLRRINLHGLTGDPSQLASLMVQFYGLQPEQSLGGQLFTTRWNNRIANLLQIAPAPVIYAGADHSKYVVFLELNQASSSFGLSPEASELLQTAQATRRW